MRVRVLLILLAAIFTSGASPAKAAPDSGQENTRTLIEVRTVFEQKKGSIYAIYNRARKQKPNLTGKVTFEVSVAPSGEVTNCRVLSSSLGDAQVEQDIAAEIRRFDFGAKRVAPMIISYPVEFLP